MKPKLYIMFNLFFILLSLFNASCLTIKYNKISPFECDTAYGVYKFNLEAKEVTNELKLTQFYIFLRFFGRNLFADYFLEALCKLENDEILSKIAYGSNEEEDLSFICRLESSPFTNPNGETVEVEVYSASSLYNTKNFYDIKLMNLGENSTTIHFNHCVQILDDYYMNAINKKLTYRKFGKPSRISSQKIQFLFSVFVSKTLPENYSFPIKVSTSLMTEYGKIFDAVCALNKTIKPSEDKIVSTIFICTIDGFLDKSTPYRLYYSSSYYINFDPHLYITPPLYYEPFDLSKENETTPIMTFTSINTDQCREEGIIKFKGKLEINLKDNLIAWFTYINIYLLSNTLIICYYSYPPLEKEIEFECSLEDPIIQSRIAIERKIFFGDKEVFLIMPFYTEKKDFNCLERYDIEERYFLDISFRQVSKFKINNISNTIEFNLYGITINDNLDYIRKPYIPIIVNLIKRDQSIESIARCTIQNIFIMEEKEKKQAEFNCIISGLDKIQDYLGVEIIFSNIITGFPTDPELRNPSKVDKLISSGLIKDYSLSKNINETIPFFFPSFINTNNSEITGKFIINGRFINGFSLERSIEFETSLISGEKVKCTLPKINIDDLEVQIICIFQQELKESILYFPQCAILDGYNEIIRLNKIKSEEPVNATNGEEIEYENLFHISLSFEQILGFQAEENTISFIFIGFSTEILKKNESIEMVVNLIKEKELVEEKALCFVIEGVQTKDEEQIQIKFECKIENIENGKEFIGLELVSSINIAGIPSFKDLLNPAKVDILINEGKIKNYTSEEIKNETIPIFNAISINTTNSEKTGIFIINGEKLSNFTLNKRKEFEITLVSGQKAKCILPKLNSDEKEVKIKCVLQEE